MTGAEQELTIHVGLEGQAAGHVSGLLAVPSGVPRACLVLAHGAGAGMTHGFLAAVATGLREREIACLRYQFPYMQAGSKRPDRPAVATAAVRAAVAAAVAALPGVPIFAGGKSFGGRMTSTTQAALPLPGVRGLVFLGFPLHPAGRPGIERARHLGDIREPMLFVQGTRDTLADLALLRPVLDALTPQPTLVVVDGADHSFHVAKRRVRTAGQPRTASSGRSKPAEGAASQLVGSGDADVLAGILDNLAAWMATVPGA